ncbi:MAG: phosphoribosylamine--glycine ligase [Bacillaceae bacterium G1]|nr:MAG: phosphoribosylamine--glycine ligase [Bacillaceae bacterium G1]
MKVLVVGQGGREHALVWKLAQSPRVSRLYCAPGNAGIAELATCVPISETDLDGLVRFAKEEGIDLTVVGPEAPLVAGLVDRFEAEGLRVFGPRKEAAMLEGSKAFAKEIMSKYGIPTAQYQSFEDYDEALRYVREHGAPIVLKADGLAAGKGVTVAQTLEEAEAALERMMKDKVFGEAGKRVVVEEFLQGQELSLMAFVDGETVLPMVPVQDHKPVFDGDKGPNTGGMGTYSPTPQLPQSVIEESVERILKPVAKAMVAEGKPYRGVLYGGLMVTAEGPKVIEFNARFGDPETQVVLPRLETDLLDVLEAVVEGRLADIQLQWKREAAVCVILASEGYPGSYPKGRVIEGLFDPEEQRKRQVYLFHSGTARKDGQWLTNGGRVLGVTALGEDLAAAREKAYRAIEEIRFEGMHYRKDIGLRGLSV